MRLSIRAVTSFFSSLVLAGLANAGHNSFPTGPNTDMTPGAICESADEFRYPERIPYCNRDVETKLKNEIIRKYDQELGFNIQSMPRAKFKIDHFIPLCMGGSNDRSNLWPQHESVYKVTDPLEPLLCNKMAQGKLLQAEAMQMIRRAKLHLEEAQEILGKASSL